MIMSCLALERYWKPRDSPLLSLSRMLSKLMLPSATAMLLLALTVRWLALWLLFWLLLDL